MSILPEFARAKQPHTPEEIFALCDLDLRDHILTVMSDSFGVPREEVPEESVAMSYNRVRVSFLDPDSDDCRAHYRFVADAMVARGTTFEAFSTDHQRLQTLMLSSLLERTQRYLGLGAEGAGNFLAAMNRALMGMFRAFDDIERERSLRERAGLERQLQQSLGAVVRGAQAGDLSGRVDSALDDPRLAAIGVDLNALMETLHTGIGAAMRALDGLARGQLSARMEGTFEGDFRLLQDNIRQSIDATSGVLSRIKTVAAEITRASDVLDRQAGALRDRSLAEQTHIDVFTEGATGLRDALTANRDAADTARTALDGIAEAAGDAGTGMLDVTETMGRIADGSADVQRLTDLIDTFAHQTHLLSLNAAVEAARAGEAGRGFAVVATEVRSLATRVTQGAEEIRRVVARNAERVADGRESTAATQRMLDELQDSLAGIRTVFDQIIDGNAVQSERFGAVETTMAAMSHSMTRNVEAAEAGVSLARDLTTATQSLTDLLKGFDLGRPADAPGKPMTTSRPGDGRAA
ncbi:methyl-accepting chemotaxis protein [Jannaschia marina]|uniref:methyl-accepting chemotaxis protein n=1 Tax=Jannaschia marina TaxID=2741674 RepID=UPI0015CC5D7B|nr:methyl-accepting chemotaxis protein [Jannaschia marina]